jgi:Holliday junction resolvase RusA-like endonuclease
MIDSGSHGLRAWQRSVTQAALEAMEEVGWETLDGVPVACRLAFTMPASQVNLRKVKRDGLVPSLTMPDLDKVVRSTLDALTAAGVWTDDRLVARLSASKVYGEEPGALIQVQEWKP